MSWNRSVPEAAGRAVCGAADATATPETAMAPAATAAPAAPMSRLRMFGMMLSPSEVGDPGGMPVTGCTGHYGQRVSRVNVGNHTV
jgi:hypothetical protein